MNNPETPPVGRSSRRPVWLLGIAILALGGVLFSLASLQSGKAQDSALPPNLQSNPVATELYQKLADAQATAASPKSVDMTNYAFSPSSLQVSVGDTVTWTNHDSAPHNVVVTDGPEKFSSPLIEQGQSWSYTFTKAGTYSYYCSVHPDMKATVTVTGGATTEPTTGAPTGGSKPTTSMSMPSAPASSSSSSMAMPSSTPGGSSGCVSKEVLQPIFDHVKSAHLETSPGQQVSDLLNLDQYVKTHTVWLEQVLTPLMNQTTC